MENIPKFEIKEVDGMPVVFHHHFPRFSAEITFNGIASDLGAVVFIDNVNDVMLLAKLMRETGEYILSSNRNK